MGRQEVADYYEERGLVARYGYDKPHKTYPPHSHEKTYLFTLAGSMMIRLDGGVYKAVVPNAEIVVESGQLHEAIIGDGGWEYVAAWDAEEAKLYPDTHA